jgi:lipid II:glycine glycyltransferase (peptidoglycan interpeptide bridge formation enzyme)
LRRYQSKRPNDILYWEAIKWGCKNDYKIFDFGGAGSPGKKYGVREFKEKFGGNLVNHGRFIKAYKPAIMRVINSGIEFFKKI